MSSSESDRDSQSETIGIVFLHHEIDEVTANHLQSFRDWNPDAKIVTVSASEPFPGGYSIHDFPAHAERWERHTSEHGLEAKSADLLLYAWYENRHEHCDRWVIVEWDAFCGMAVEDFFGLVWDFDLVVPTVRWRNRDPDWYWFSTVQTMPPDLQQFAVGITPFCFIFARDTVLHAICQKIPWEQLGKCNGELRFGTLAYACGFVPITNPLASWNIGWLPLPESTSVHTGMWHPVKWLVLTREAQARQ